MSTRANVILTESYMYKGKHKTQKLFFYRHSDGYPEGTMPTLTLFCNLIKNGKIRGDLSQSSGWLILIGAMEYNTIPEYETKQCGSTSYGIIETFKEPKDWKVGATDKKHNLQK